MIEIIILDRKTMCTCLFCNSHIASLRRTVLSNCEVKLKCSSKFPCDIPVVFKHFEKDMAIIVETMKCFNVRFYRWGHGAFDIECFYIKLRCIKADKIFEYLSFPVDLYS